jgi:hypothetical protein
MSLDMVKHQVMVNYLYQQQGNNGWRNERSSDNEGVLLRLSRDNYVTCPPQLLESQLASAMSMLNMQVSHFISQRGTSLM